MDEMPADERRVAATPGGLRRDARSHRPAPRTPDRVPGAQRGQLDDSLVLGLSDNGASQEGGPLGFVNVVGPYNLIHETTETKLARLVIFGGPDTHTNFPWGWAMAAI